MSKHMHKAEDVNPNWYALEGSLRFSLDRLTFITNNIELAIAKGDKPSLQNIRQARAAAKELEDRLTELRKHLLPLREGSKDIIDIQVAMYAIKARDSAKPKYAGNAVKMSRYAEARAFLREAV